MKKYFILILCVFTFVTAAYAQETKNIDTGIDNSVFEKNEKIYPVPKQISIKVRKKEFTETEVKILQNLESKRIEIDRKAQLLMVREKLLDISESKLVDKIKQLEILQKDIQKLLVIVSEKEEKRLVDLTIVYSAMKPALAAERLDALDEQTVYEILKRMKFKNSAKILEKMNVKKVKIISEMLAKKTVLPKVRK